MYGGEGDRRQCGGCKRWVSRANYARHVRSCGRVEAGGAVVRVGRGGQVRMATCGGCGREMRAGNLARHQRGRAECGTRDGGQTPGGGRWPNGWMDRGALSESWSEPKGERILLRLKEAWAGGLSIALFQG